MAKYKQRKTGGYGIGNPIADIFPNPIVAKRDPVGGDNGYTQGQVWINETTNITYILTSVAAGISNWEQSSGNELNAPVEIGDATVREGALATDWSAEGNIFQVYANDAAATGANYRKAGRFDLTVSSGDATDSPQALRGQITHLTGSSHEEGYAGYFWANQDDGSNIDSNLIGAIGGAYMEETDAADAPAQWTFGIQGILTAADTAAAPGGTSIQAGIASFVTYNTPLNTVAHGFVATRNGGGAGGTAGSAYKVIAGGGINDWDYIFDAFDAGLGPSTADLRFSNRSTILAATEGVTFSGDIDARAIVATNTRMTLSQGPVMSTKANTGGAPTGGTGDENLMVMQDGELMEQHILGAGQTIIAPRMDANGLLISLDLTDDEGAEYGWGILGTNKHAFTIGTSPAFYFECRVRIADVTGADPVYIGFRKQEAYQGTFTNYTDFALIGVEETQNTALITIADQLNTGGVTYTNTTDAWADGETHILRVNVSAAGVVTYLIDGVAPTVTNALTFDNADVVMPCIYFLQGTTAPGEIHLIAMECGYQEYS